MKREAALELREVSKSFGATRALERVTLSVLPGEIHVLAGANGAGKSTLIRILSGVHTDYEGTLFVCGNRARFRGPEDAKRAGIATMHQELSLIGSLSVADNLLLGEPERRPWTYRPKHERARARVRVAPFLPELDVDRRIETLPLAIQQQVEIARALLSEARVLIFDEATSALGEHDAAELGDRVRALAERGTAILYISHRIPEIFSLAHRISVLCDGKLVLSAARAELDSQRLVRAMLGERGPERERAELRPSGEPVLEVRDLRSGEPGRARPLVDSIALCAAKGEILGLAGLSDSGASAVLHAVFGSRGRPERSDIWLEGRRFVPESPQASIARGVVLLASDRALSLVSTLGITENVTLSSLERFTRAGVIRRRTELRAALALLDQVNVPAASVQGRAARRAVSELSGGNQQKVALARCLLARPKVLLLDEPTRGVDVGAKWELHALVRRLAAAGLCVLFTSSELDELLALATRILVFQKGRVVDELERSDFDKQRVLGRAMGDAAS